MRCLCLITYKHPDLSDIYIYIYREREREKRRERGGDEEGTEKFIGLKDHIMMSYLQLMTFLPMESNAAIPMEEVCGPKGVLWWKINLILWDYLGQPENFSPDLRICIYSLKILFDLTKKRMTWSNETFLFIIIMPKVKQNKVGDSSRGWPEGSLFNSYYTEV